MSYSVLILPGASRQLARLPRKTMKPTASGSLRSSRSPRNRCRLRGRDGRRVHGGSYRVIYEIDAGSRLVTVLEVGRRSDA
jgi:mRNA-degrading endonuclease RelE of RelBE toxin-antitoxin system